MRRTVARGSGERRDSRGPEWRRDSQEKASDRKSSKFEEQPGLFPLAGVEGCGGAWRGVARRGVVGLGSQSPRVTGEVGDRDGDNGGTERLPLHSFHIR